MGSGSNPSRAFALGGWAEKEKGWDVFGRQELSGSRPTVTSSLPASFQGSVRSVRSDGELTSIRVRR